MLWDLVEEAGRNHMAQSFVDHAQGLVFTVKAVSRESTEELQAEQWQAMPLQERGLEIVNLKWEN